MSQCATCGGNFQSLKSRTIFCSPKCRGAAHRGAANPNYSNAAEKICSGCGRTFYSYNKIRKYCSKPCHVKHHVISPELREKYRLAGLKSPTGARRKGTGKGMRGTCKECGVEFYFKTRRLYCEAHQPAARMKGLRVAVAKTRKPKNRACQHCGKPFRAGPRSVRKFCAYTCFVASGGPIRAGLDAKRMTRIYGAKKDANHTEIVAVIKKMRIPFIDMSGLGYGVPDLVVEIHGKLELWEIKNKKTGYGKRGLNKNQKAWAENWTGNPVVLIHSIDDVLIRAGVAIGAVR